MREYAKHRYSVGTWDTNCQAYTPQRGAGRSINITWGQLRRVLRRLRNGGYSAHRMRDADGDHSNNDYSVLVERTDGMSRQEIMDGWKRQHPGRRTLRD